MMLLNSDDDSLRLMGDGNRGWRIGKEESSIIVLG